MPDCNSRTILVLTGFFVTGSVCTLKSEMWRDSIAGRLRRLRQDLHKDARTGSAEAQLLLQGWHETVEGLRQELRLGPGLDATAVWNRFVEGIEGDHFGNHSCIEMFCQLAECCVILWNVENGHPMLIQYQNRKLPTRS